MNLELMKAELEQVNSCDDFWKALDSNFSQASCSHDHGQGEKHFNIAGNFSIAQQKIGEAIEIVFGEDFDVNNQEHRNHLFVLAAVQKAQDQLSVGSDFVSTRTSEFNKYFNISDSLAGKNIAGENVAMPNAKKYLVEKFNLSSTRAKADVILASQETALTKARNLVDLGFKDAVDPLIEVAGSLYKAAPSLMAAGLLGGTAQMVLRSFGDQETANKLRNNIGASTEAAAFFVLVNGVLENLFHSFILAAPAFTAVAAYDSAYSKLKPIYDYYINSTRSENEISQTSIINVDEFGANDSDDESLTSFVTAYESLPHHEISKLPTQENSTKTLDILKRTKSLIDEDEMWIGLRKHQLAYQDNDLENNLKNRLQNLITASEENPNQLSQEDFRQTLRDSFEMIKAYAEVYENKNPASGVKQFLHEFCDHFACNAILLAEPSKEAKSAAFYCRSYNGLVSFEERVKESLPHMPTGQQVLLAATVIGALYSASAIYKFATGEEEVYSDYVTNFPDHLFEWLHLDQMYQNMGGGAEITESFKDFFAGFNLAENSTHLGIAVAPFLAYAQMGSKMFDGITHAPANYLAYAADLTSSYVTATKAAIGNWFSNSKSAVTVDLSSDIKTTIDLEKGSVLEEKSDEEKSDENNSQMVFCGDFDTISSKMNPATRTKNRHNSKHTHGPKCNHL